MGNNRQQRVIETKSQLTRSSCLADQQSIIIKPLDFSSSLNSVKRESFGNLNCPRPVLSLLLLNCPKIIRSD